MPKLDPVVKAARVVEARIKSYLHAADTARNPSANPNGKRASAAMSKVGDAVFAMENALYARNEAAHAAAIAS